MPGLHNSNICWGNRKSFNAFPDIFGESFPAMETQSYISTNSYYGYERITPESPPKDESDKVEVMDTSDEINKTRKRQGGECIRENSKRIRQDKNMELAALIKKKEHSVYILCCVNQDYMGDVYIGYTVNHKKRLKQHNLGINQGGAKKTDKKKPWEMVLIIKGFASQLAALRFEWTLQKASKLNMFKTRTNTRKSKGESKLSFTMRFLNILLSIPPWNRAPLEIHVLKPEYFTYGKPDLSNCPDHIPIISPSNGEFEKHSFITMDIFENTVCFICLSTIKIDHEYLMHCYFCKCVFHMTCLADRFTERNHVVPTKGPCPCCRTNLLWGTLIRSAIKLNPDDHDRTVM